MPPHKTCTGPIPTQHPPGSAHLSCRPLLISFSLQHGTHNPHTQAPCPAPPPFAASPCRPLQISCSLQYGGPWPANRVTEVKVPPADPAKPWGGHWHVYALEWERRQIRW